MTGGMGTRSLEPLATYKIIKLPVYISLYAICVFPISASMPYKPNMSDTIMQCFYNVMELLLAMRPDISVDYGSLQTGYVCTSDNSSIRVNH